MDDTIFTEEEIEKFPENKCCSLEALEHAREVAQQYEMPFYVMNTSEVFKSQIVDYFIDGFAGGVTPNPCVECNRSIKFGFLIDKMKELGADFLATGHYAKVEKVSMLSSGIDAKLNPEIEPAFRYALRMADDKVKDQSYFLYTLTQEKLKHCIFPLSKLTKDEVREIAEEEKLLKVIEKKESQGICFFPEKDHVPFLQRQFDKNEFDANPGPMLTAAEEEKGEHRGLAFYTIGQREGLNIGGPDGPWYVIKKDPERNVLIVGPNEDLFAREVHADSLTFIEGGPPAEALAGEGLRILARLRHRFTPNDAVLKIDNPEDYDPKNPDSLAKLTATVIYDDPQRAITPGQSIVFYRRDEVLGGGIII
jgi:tRNA-specific 2-thiouridylase